MLNRTPWAVFAVVIVIAGCQAKSQTESKNPSLTNFVVDAGWPKTLPNNWILGQVSGIAVDGDDNIWIVNRPLTLTEREAGAVQDPPVSTCCVPAPSIIQFDQEGNVLQAWGGQDSDEQWPQSEHGLNVDGNGNVWMASNGGRDQVVLKFSPEGERLLQIGEWGVTGGSNDTAHLGGPTDIAVDLETNEVYVSDGYQNRRVIVYDATTGEYKRHWGGYGDIPDDGPLGEYQSDADPTHQFRSPMHAVRISNDGLVYAADRVNNRIQVFQKDGTFVSEGFIAKNTLGMGSVWDLEFSVDDAQTYIYVPDGTNMKVWVVRRDDFSIVNSFGTGGRQAGQFNWIHNLAADSHGNLYTSEVNTGKRVQRFVPVSD